MKILRELSKKQNSPSLINCWKNSNIRRISSEKWVASCLISIGYEPQSWRFDSSIIRIISTAYINPESYAFLCVTLIKPLLSHKDSLDHWTRGQPFSKELRRPSCVALVFEKSYLLYKWWTEVITTVGEFTSEIYHLM